MKITSVKIIKTIGNYGPVKASQFLGRFIDRSFGRSTHNLFFKKSCMRCIERILPNQPVVTYHRSGSQPIDEARFPQYGAYSSFSKKGYWSTCPITYL